MPRWILPAYAVAFFLVLMGWRSYRVWKQTGVNPIVIKRGDRAHDYVGQCMVWVFLVIAAFLVVYGFFPSAYPWLEPIPWLEHRSLKMAGLILLTVSFVWIAVAQAQMGASFRVGVDQEHRTEMVAHGLFRISRNPIFLGMTVTLLGFFLAAPNMVSLVVLILGHVLIQIQVRLEEEHLEKLHGESYLAYRRRVRRWL
ncbi:MAG: isoprenylcysteine carboxylmethyltransferase family protein [Nitrospirae bacterium]|nr:isoprenylcysteine carboxylmethyltransferase family protein [Nitrospirota bacterium]